MATYWGACHCGKVRFRVSGELSVATVCNCSICTKKGLLHWIVEPACFELVSGAEELTRYRFNTGAAEHTFCRTCGVQPFYTPRSDPDKVDVNVRCLEGVELRRLPLRDFDGRNWEQAIETAHWQREAPHGAQGATPAIVDLRPGAPAEEAAAVLFESFVGRTDSWPDLDAARSEVARALEDGKLARAALDAEGRVIGWIGAMPHYRGRVWELHPLVVAERHRGRGVGRALVGDLERLVAARGALTLWVGSDDETHETSVSGVDLYTDVAGHIRGLQNLGRHPVEFYQEVGFTAVGFMPDANGRGRPDIFLAKPIGLQAK